MANAGIADPIEQDFFEDPHDYTATDSPPPPGLRTYETNLTGVLYTSHLALSYLSQNPDSHKCSAEKNEGPRDRHLLLVASIAGLAGVPSQPLYAAAKHGVVGLFRSLRMTAPAKTGVRVNMINPCKSQTILLLPHRLEKQRPHLEFVTECASRFRRHPHPRSFGRLCPRRWWPR